MNLLKLRLNDGMTFENYTQKESSDFEFENLVLAKSKNTIRQNSKFNLGIKHYY